MDNNTKYNIDYDIKDKIGEAIEKAIVLGKKHVRYIVDDCSYSRYMDELVNFMSMYPDFRYVYKIVMCGYNRFCVNIVLCDDEDYELFVKNRSKLLSKNDLNKITDFSFITEGNYIHFCNYLNMNTIYNWHAKPRNNNFFANEGIPDFIIGPNSIEKFNPPCKCNIL